jgi:hypothetical protein
LYALSPAVEFGTATVVGLIGVGVFALVGEGFEPVDS